MIVKDVTKLMNSKREGRGYVTQLQAANEKLKVQAQELRAARQSAEEANAAKDRFPTIIAHELRTPLQNIMGYSHLLTVGNLDDAAAKRAAGIIEQNAKVQVHLVEDLLDIGRLTTGNPTLDLHEIDVVQVVTAALETVSLKAEVKGVKIRVADSVGGQCSVWGDPRRMQQVIWNLLTNAIRHTPMGGGILVDLKTETDTAKVSVTDSGDGIAPDFLPHIFDPFRQEKPSGRGAGLGLAIVDLVVKLHGGSVTAASAGPGQGATFTVSLPLFSPRQRDRTSH